MSFKSADQSITHKNAKKWPLLSSCQALNPKQKKFFNFVLSTFYCNNFLQFYIFHTPSSLPLTSWGGKKLSSNFKLPQKKLCSEIALRGHPNNLFHSTQTSSSNSQAGFFWQILLLFRCHYCVYLNYVLSFTL